MRRVIIDETIREKFHQFAEPLELCDEAGRLLARLFPTIDLSQYERWEPPIDEAEMQRREQPDQQFYTTAELLERLDR